MDDEFKQYGRETNKAISEFQEFQAVEYYAPQEFATQEESTTSGPESSVDSSAQQNNNLNNNNTNNSNENFDSDKYTNKADGEKSPDINTQNETSVNMDGTSATNAAGDSSLAAAEEAGASAASTVGASSTVASLAGGITVVAAAAVAAVAVGGSIANRAPTVLSEAYDSGTNYLTYEFDLAELTEGTEYKVRVSNASFSVEYPINGDGITRQLVTGLTPYRRYDVDIIGVAEELGDIVYYSHPVYTNKEPKPKAVFDFIADFDMEFATFDITYETYISDFYHTGSNTYMQITIDGNLVIDDHNLFEDSFFRGEIEGLTDFEYFEAVAYTTYYDELVEIGRTGYSPEYPLEFEEARKQPHEPVASVGFVEDFDPAEDIYNVDYNVNITDKFKTGSDFVVKELIENEVVNEIELDSLSYKGSFKNIYNGANIAVIVYSKYNGEEELIVIGSGEKKVEHPEPFKNMEFNLYESGFYVGMEYANSESNKEFTLKIIEHKLDNTDVEITNTFVSRCSYEGEFGDNIKPSDFKSFDVSVLYNDKTIISYTVDNDSSVENGTLDADEDGNILIPYNLSLPKGAEFIEGGIYFSLGGQEYSNISETSGNIIISELTSNKLEGGEVRITYKMPNGVTISTVVYIDDIDIGAEFKAEYYAHVNSSYDTLYLKYDATLNDKPVNSSLTPTIIVDGEESYPTNKNGEYYECELSTDSETKKGVRFKLSIPGYESEETFVEVVEYINNEYSSDYDSNLGNYSVSEIIEPISQYGNEHYIRYFKTTNEDGTVNYYFNPEFVDNATNKHFYRIEYTYEDDGTKYRYGDFVNTPTYELLNIPDRNYDFKFRVFFKSASGLYYDGKLADSPHEDNTYRSLKEITNEKVLYDDAIAVLENAISKSKDTVINFKLDYNNLIFDEPIEINYKGNQYEIPLKLSTDSSVEIIDDEYYIYSDEADDYNYKVYVYNNKGDLSYVHVEFVVNNVSYNDPGFATITYMAEPKTVLDSYEGMNPADYRKFTTKIIGQFEGSYDFSNASFDLSDGWYYNSVSINDLNFITSDSNSVIEARVYFKGNEIDRYTLNPNENDYYHSFDPGYSDLTIKFYEIKKQEIIDLIDTDSYVLESDANIDLVCNDGEPVFVKDVSLRKMDVVKDISVTMEGVSYSIAVNELNSQYDSNSEANQGQNYTYYIQAYGYDKDGKLLDGALSDMVEYTNATTISYEAINAIERIDVHVIFSMGSIEKVCQIISIDKPSIENYTYDDLNDQIRLLFNLNIPVGVTLSSDSHVTFKEDEISASDGVVIIDELDSNIVDLKFDYSYVNNGITITVNNLLVSKELHGDLDFTYDVYSALANSSYGNYSVNRDIRYDVDNDVIYYYRDGSYYDSDGNQYSGTETSATYEHTIYYIKGKVVEKIGKYSFDTTSYTVNVKKSGGSVIDSSTGELYDNANAEANVLQNEFSLNGENIPGVYLTFLHTELGHTYLNSTVTGYSKCELVFDLVNADGVTITKTIEFSEPAPAGVPDSSAFTYDRTTTNNSVTLNLDNTINLSINTGFDSSLYPNYKYKIYLEKQLDYYDTSNIEPVYESDFVDTPSITIMNLENTNYEVYLKIFYLQDGIYVPVTNSSGDRKSLGRANSPIVSNEWSYDSTEQAYTNVYYLDTNYMNPDYLDGTKSLVFNSYNIDLSNTSTLQTLSGVISAQVEDQGDGILKLSIIGRTNSSNARGNLVIEQGNASIGYTEVTYSI